MTVLEAGTDAPGIAVVLGTRPEIIKLAEIIRLLGPRVRFIHTGQHYDDELSGRFLRELRLPEPTLVLEGLTGHGRSAQIGGGIVQLGRYFETERPGAVIVQGDTNSTSMGAQAGYYAGVPVLHVEAGLRSWDRAMPEEINRLVVGAVADVHCAATSNNADNLLREGVDPARIMVTGNTVVEATRDALSVPHALPQIPEGRFILATIHRPENTDDPVALQHVLESLAGAGLPVLLVLHPRTAAAIERAGLTPALAGITVIPPIGHTDFLELARAATLLISDSGGVQEETTVIGTPLLVLRRSTERPEAIAAGFARMVQPGESLSTGIREILTDDSLHERLARTPSPYGDGQASHRIVQAALAIADGASATSVTLRDHG